MSKASGASGPRTISSNSFMPTTPKGSFFQNFVRFTGAGGVHDEDDTVPLGLEVPLLDLPSEMVPNRGADLEGQDGDNRLGARRSVTSDSRTTSPRVAVFLTSHDSAWLTGERAHGVRRLPITRPDPALFRLISVPGQAPRRENGDFTLATKAAALR